MFVVPMIRNPASALVLMLLLLAACTSDKPAVLKTAEPDTRLADLSGAWEIDYKHTEDPQAKLRYLYDVVRSQINQQQRRPDQDPRETSQAIRDLQGVIQLGTLADDFARATVLNIDQSDGFITINRSEHYALTCDFLVPVADLKVGQESCGFDSAGRLVFIAQLPEGLTVINRYSLSPGDLSDEEKRLYVSQTLISDKFARPFTLNRVYMLFPPGSGMYKCEYTIAKKTTCWLGKDPNSDN